MYIIVSIEIDDNHFDDLNADLLEDIRDSIHDTITEVAIDPLAVRVSYQREDEQKTYILRAQPIKLPAKFFSS